MLAPRRGTRSGFTLIELLVVIAIIAILAAILFPVFAKAREKARTASCASNCKQINVAIMQYAQDYDERLVMRNYTVAALQPGWADFLQPYMKSYQVFICPSESSQLPSQGNTWTNSGGYVINNLGYDGAINDPPTAESGPFGTYRGIWHMMPGLARFGAPAETVLFGDGVSAAGTCQAVFLGGSLTASPPTLGGTQAYFKGRHTERANFAFADGHVKLLRLEDMVSNNYNLLRIH